MLRIRGQDRIDLTKTAQLSALQPERLVAGLTNHLRVVDRKHHDFRASMQLFDTSSRFFLEPGIPNPDNLVEQKNLGEVQVSDW